MRQDHWTTIERWLQTGAPDASSPELEAAWTRLFEELPDESPSAAFPGRVMARASPDCARPRARPVAAPAAGAGRLPRR